MRNPHRRIGGVDRLPTRAGGAEHINPKVAFLDIDIDILGLGEDRHRRRRGVDAAAGLGFRDALHPMHARLEFQPREHIASGDVGRGFLVAADARLRHFHDLEPPAMLGRETLIHAEQVGGEQRRLIAAGTGPHLEDGVARIIPVAWQQQHLQCLHLVRQPRLHLIDLGTRHLHDLGIAIGLVDHLHGRIAVRLETADKLNLLADRAQLGKFA